VDIKQRFARGLLKRACSAMELGSEMHSSFAKEVLSFIKPPYTAVELNEGVTVLGNLVHDTMAPSDLPDELKTSAIRDMTTFMIGSAWWASLGCPVFNLTLDFFRAVAVTDFGEVGDVPLQLPFPSFFIRYPETLGEVKAKSAFVYPLPTRDEATGETGFDLRRMSISAADALRQGFTQWVDGYSLDKFLHEKAKRFEDIDMTERKASEQLKQPINNETLAHARRILGNLTLYINENGGLPTSKKLGADVPIEREHSTLPRFRVGRPIKLAPRIRQALANGGTGATWELDKRFIVRGHWRNVPHGPQKSLRRKQWISPFWKGAANIADALERTYSVE